MSDASAHVTLKRLPRPLGDLLRTYRVLINGTEVGGIRRKQTKTFEVPPGRHQIQLKIDWCTSREITIDLKPGAEAKLTCSAKPPNLGWTVLGSSNYVQLDVVDAVVVADSPSPVEWPPPPPTKPEPLPGAPSDTEIEAAWARWTEASDRASSIRRKLQGAIEAGDEFEADRLKHEVRDMLREHEQLAAEYTRMKELRPDWQAPARRS